MTDLLVWLVIVFLALALIIGILTVTRAIAGFALTIARWLIIILIVLAILSFMSIFI